MKKILFEIDQMPMGRKILLILMPGLLLLSITAIISFWLMIRSSNHLFYEKSAEVLSYSSKDISQNLYSIQDMANVLLEDAVIQTRLSEVKDTQNIELPANAYSNLQATLNNYYHKYKASYIESIQLVNSQFENSVSSPESRMISPEILESLMEKAQKEDGRICWITDYSNTYGLFLVRTIRRIEHLKLDELGVLIINININKMIEDLPNNAQNTASTSYLLCTENKILAASPSIRYLSYQNLPKLDSSYKIMDIESIRYFAVTETIPITGWVYYGLSPYDEVYNPILFFQKMFVLLIVVSVMLCILLTNILMKPILLHFKNLIIKIKAFGSDNFEIVDIPYSYENRHDEIGLLHQQFDKMAYKIQTLIRENYETTLLAKESQLKALEMQINPHFLYNTLDSINWRAKALGDISISSMTESLGKLLRITLNKRLEDSTLKQEISLVKYYMNIQQIRYEEQLTFSLEISEEISDAYIPKFTLEPLVENAIRYTLEEDSDECNILIQAKLEGSNISITIENSHSQFEQNLLSKLISGEILPHGFGIGILNVNQRLHLAFHHSYQLNFYNRQEYAVVQIVIPYQNHAQKKEEVSNATFINCRR